VACVRIKGRAVSILARNPFLCLCTLGDLVDFVWTGAFEDFFLGTLLDLLTFLEAEPFMEREGPLVETNLMVGFESKCGNLVETSLGAGFENDLAFLL